MIWIRFKTSTASKPSCLSFGLIELIYFDWQAVSELLPVMQFFWILSNPFVITSCITCCSRQVVSGTKPMELLVGSTEISVGRMASLEGWSKMILPMSGTTSVRPMMIGQSTAQQRQFANRQLANHMIKRDSWPMWLFTNLKAGQGDS